jgi:hypothetical protein
MTPCAYSSSPDINSIEELADPPYIISDKVTPFLRFHVTHTHAANVCFISGFVETRCRKNGGSAFIWVTTFFIPVYLDTGLFAIEFIADSYL